MNALTLKARAIRSLTQIDDASDEPQVIPSDDLYVWLNSPHELEHGLEVVEINTELDCGSKLHDV